MREAKWGNQEYKVLTLVYVSSGVLSVEPYKSELLPHCKSYTSGDVQISQPELNAK